MKHSILSIVFFSIISCRIPPDLKSNIDKSQKEIPFDCKTDRLDSGIVIKYSPSNKKYLVKKFSEYFTYKGETSISSNHFTTAIWLAATFNDTCEAKKAVFDASYPDGRWTAPYNDLK